MICNITTKNMMLCLTFSNPLHTFTASGAVVLMTQNSGREHNLPSGSGRYEHSNHPRTAHGPCMHCATPCVWRVHPCTCTCTLTCTQCECITCALTDTTPQPTHSALHGRVYVFVYTVFSEFLRQNNENLS